ncbi:MAG: tRNA (5-methylaminomethyl-2-thiouridine)(34)-methyltransferase MnmD [Rhizobiaceae bacterium]
MNELKWQDGNLPVSSQFDDPYYSRHDGRAETDHVFIHGNRLLERWLEMQSCTIAELGFGTGLNFLETVRQWKCVKPDGARLRFISFEQYPISTKDMEKALSAWPELGEFKPRLLEHWESVPGTLDVEFASDIRLTIHIGDANRLLPELDFLADAWFLDGFSPAKNPELWNNLLMNEVARHTVVGGTFSTYSAAGFVRRSLEASGFQVRKQKGFGSKREMLSGKMQDDIHVADRH